MCRHFQLNSMLKKLQFQKIYTSVTNTIEVNPTFQVTEGASTKATTMATTTALAAGSAAEGSRGTRGDLTRAAAAAAIRAAAGPSSRGTSRADLEDGRRPSQQVSIAASSRD